MKIKTTDLIGPTLDWAVDQCEASVAGHKNWYQDFLNKGVLSSPRYSDDWARGGPIIEREAIELVPDGKGSWCAAIRGGDEDDVAQGPTPLIAAMRCYVASKLGDEIDVPDTLAN
jgi:hypothetical protein